MRLSDRIQRACFDEGFSAVGAVDYGPEARAIYDTHFKRYEKWVASSCHAEMGYLSRGLERRRDPRLVFEEIQSVVCVSLNYPSVTESTSSDHGAKYARYLETRDYHDEISERFERALNRAFNDDEKGSIRFKICVDTSAVLERTWGAITGLGWIGKNTLLMNRESGSYFLIGVAFLNVALSRLPSEVANLCGHCTRCIEMCPTQALSVESGLDARRCIGYWTIEKRGPLDALTASDRSAIGTWVAGCDICQEVCPFNQKRMKRDDMASSSPLTRVTRFEELLSETEEAYFDRIKGTAMTRIKFSDFKRNVQIAYENRKQKT